MASTRRLPPTRTLTSRIVLMAVLVAVASVLITGVAMIGLIRQGAVATAAASLSRDADTVAATTADIEQRRAPRQRQIRRVALNQLLTRRQITLAEVDAASDPADPASGAGLKIPFTSADVATVRRTGTLSTQRKTSRGTFLIAGRSVGTTSVLLAQPLDQAVAQSSAIGRRRLLIPLGLGLLGGAVAGLALARQIAAPLGRLATAARRLSGGDRAVRVPPDGPREVADVAQALNGLAAALAESEARQRRFLMNVSHELRTPLTAVTGYAEALADGVITGDAVQPAAVVIRDEAARLDHRVEDLLALARMEADDFRLQLGPADLLDLVRAAGRAWQPRAEAAGIRLRVAVGGLPIMVTTDAERVRQAIDALADNALRVLSAGHTLTFGCGLRSRPDAAGTGNGNANGNGTGNDSGTGNRAGRDDTRGAGDDGMLGTGGTATWNGAAAWVEVRDDGPGLSPDDLAVAFDRGRLTERYRGERPVGSGLGLALVGELARRLGGVALARAANEGGVSFVVVLPVGPPNGSNPNTARTFHEPTGHPAPGE